MTMTSATLSAMPKPILPGFTDRIVIQQHITELFEELDAAIAIRPKDWRTCLHRWFLILGARSDLSTQARFLRLCYIANQLPSVQA